MGPLWTILLNLPIVVGARWTAGRGFGMPAGSMRWLAASVLGWAWITVGMEVFGTIGLLSRGPLLAWSLIGGTIGLACRLRWPEPDAIRSPAGSGEPLGLGGTIALGLALWAWTMLTSNSLLRPVKVVSDGPIYHLWFAARWAEAGRVFPVPTPFGDNVATYFPANGDLWFAWLVIGWGGETLVKVGQGPFLPIAALAVYAMARRLGAGRPASSIAACWLALVTPSIVFASEANVDAILLAGYLASACFLLRYALGDAGIGSIALGGLAAGLSWGCKPTGLVFVPPMLGLAALAVLRRPIPLRSRLGHLLVLAGTPLLTAGYWYARNALLTGNPLYPLQIEVGGRVLLTGWFGSDVMTRSRYYLPREDWRAMVDTLLQVLDPRLAPLWIASVLGVVLFGNRAGDRSSRRAARVLGVLSAVLFGLYWALIPYRTQQRFMFPAVGIAAVPLALLLDRGRALRALGVCLLAVHALTAQGWPWAGPGMEAAIPWDLSSKIPNAMGPPIATRFLDPDLFETTKAAWEFGHWMFVLRGALAIVGPALVGLAAFDAARRVGRAARFPGRRSSRIAAVGSLAALLGVGGLVAFPWGVPGPLRFYPTFDYYRGWLALDRYAGADGARIAYAGTNLPYFLLGPGLKNTVRYVNINGHPDWLMHDYHRVAVAEGRPNWPDYQPDWDRLEADPDAWLSNLQADRIELLVVARPNRDTPWPIERRWADALPGRFRPLYDAEGGDPLFSIYRIERPIDGD